VDIHNKRHPSEVKVSREFVIGSSDAKAWPVILVSERQKRCEGFLSPSIARKVTPAWIKAAALSFANQGKAWQHFAKNRKT
jgi:hypothetical protein